MRGSPIVDNDDRIFIYVWSSLLNKCVPKWFVPERKFEIQQKRKLFRRNISYVFIRCICVCNLHVKILLLLASMLSGYYHVKVNVRFARRRTRTPFLLDNDDVDETHLIHKCLWGLCRHSMIDIFIFREINWLWKRHTVKLLYYVDVLRQHVYFKSNNTVLCFDESHELSQAEEIFANIVAVIHALTQLICIDFPRHNMMPNVFNFLSFSATLYWSTCFLCELYGSLAVVMEMESKWRLVNRHDRYEVNTTDILCLRYPPYRYLGSKMKSWNVILNSIPGKLNNF